MCAVVEIRSRIKRVEVAGPTVVSGIIRGKLTVKFASCKYSEISMRWRGIEANGDVPRQWCLSQVFQSRWMAKFVDDQDQFECVRRTKAIDPNDAGVVRTGFKQHLAGELHGY